MAKEKPPEPPPEDIPAWFMTYSDVITLLMTFFILLLTFSTTEPEKYEKVPINVFGKGGASGVAGHQHDALDKQSWVQRVRPRAARMAMSGSAMPPMKDEPSSKSVGRGLQAPSEEAAKKDAMTSNSFLVELAPLVNSNHKLTPAGMDLVSGLAQQLRKLPVHCCIEFSDESVGVKATSLLEHLYHVEKVRPGQAGAGVAEGIDSNSIRIVLERYNK